MVRECFQERRKKRNSHRWPDLFKGDQMTELYALYAIMAMQGITLTGMLFGYRAAQKGKEELKHQRDLFLREIEERVRAEKEALHRKIKDEKKRVLDTLSKL